MYLVIMYTVATTISTICGNYFTQHIPLHIPRRRTGPHALMINFFLLFSTRTLARRSTYIRLSKIIAQGLNSHVHNYFDDPLLHSA